MTQKKSHLISLLSSLCFSTLLVASQARASTYRPSYSSISEEDHLISVGAGISSPSVTSAIGENPAGLTNNSTSKVLFEAASGNDQLNPIGFGGGFFTGNGSVERASGSRTSTTSPTGPMAALRS